MFISIWTGKAWIGLHDDLVNSWRWSLNDSSFYGDGETEFRNWYRKQPNNLNGQQYCVVLLPGSPYDGTWDDTDCDLEKDFICYNGKFPLQNLQSHRKHLTQGLLFIDDMSIFFKKLIYFHFDVQWLSASLILLLLRLCFLPCRLWHCI